MNVLRNFFVLLTVLMIVVQTQQGKIWDEFKKRFNLTFPNEVIDEVRQRIFDKNFVIIEKYKKLHNEGKLSFEVGENIFADITNEEFVKTKCGTRIELKANTTTSNQKPCELNRKKRAALPVSVDWRTKGLVTPVKDQGQCGSCWSFSATGSLEGQNMKKTSKLISLSEQNLIDCSSNSQYGNKACNGGIMDNAFNYIKDNNGVDTSSSYTYEAKQSTCRYNANNRAATCTGYVNLPKNDESQLQNAVANIGPISVAIDASLDTFQFYQNGVFYDSRCSSTNLNHGVLIVGYGTENGSDFWWVKNSWGTGWGINGYIKMARNRNNNCGIASWAVYPTV